ncbi:MAG TPA: hypothetical protein PK250_19095 [Syntrophobacter fumaroxidans]|nr:hypothetical protein [Syntrophobacter fumaroxidans]
MTTLDETGGMRIWQDEAGKLWTLADSRIDTEIFELVGSPVLNEGTGLWYQEIQVRTDTR